MVGKKNRKVLVALYILIILWVTIFSREPGTVRIVKGLFWEVQTHQWHFIILNILLFIPLGFLLRNATDSLGAVIYGFLLSVLIELTQYAFCLGECEIDDVLNNTLGCGLGLFCGWGIVGCF